MDYVNPEALVSTEWLAEHMNAPDVRIVDASAVLPNVDRNPRETLHEYLGDLGTALADYPFAALSATSRS